MATPKRITPNSRTRRDLFFYPDDIALIVHRLRERFYMTFTRGFRMDFQYGGDSLNFSPERVLKPESAHRHLKGLGVRSELINMAVSAIERQAKEGFPKADHVRFDLWFKSLSPKYFMGDKIKEVVAATPERLKKWDHRLKTCGRTWEDITLSDGAIIRVTQALFRIVLNKTVTVVAIEGRLDRWRRGESSVSSHGLGGHVASPRAVNDP